MTLRTTKKIGYRSRRCFFSKICLRAVLNLIPFSFDVLKTNGKKLALAKESVYFEL